MLLIEYKQNKAYSLHYTIYSNEYEQQTKTVIVIVLASESTEPH